MARFRYEIIEHCLLHNWASAVQSFARLATLMQKCFAGSNIALFSSGFYSFRGISGEILLHKKSCRAKFAQQPFHFAAAVLPLQRSSKNSDEASRGVNHRPGRCSVPTQGTGRANLYVQQSPKDRRQKLHRIHCAARRPTGNQQRESRQLNTHRCPKHRTVCKVFPELPQPQSTLPVQASPLPFSV